MAERQAWQWFEENQQAGIGGRLARLYRNFFYLIEVRASSFTELRMMQILEKLIFPAFLAILLPGCSSIRTDSDTRTGATQAPSSERQGQENSPQSTRRNVPMSYDLHITKTAEWSESTKNPITEEQWISLISGDGELSIDTTATATNPKTGEVIQISHPLMASWTDPATKEMHYFRYSRGKVSVKGPSERAIKKMKEIASKLGARVQGDEGEAY